MIRHWPDFTLTQEGFNSRNGVERKQLFMSNLEQPQQFVGTAVQTSQWVSLAPEGRVQIVNDNTLGTTWVTRTNNDGTAYWLRESTGRR